MELLTGAPTCQVLTGATNINVQFKSPDPGRTRNCCPLNQFQWLKEGQTEFCPSAGKPWLGLGRLSDIWSTFEHLLCSEHGIRHQQRDGERDPGGPVRSWRSQLLLRQHLPSVTGSWLSAQRPRTYKCRRCQDVLPLEPSPAHGTGGPHLLYPSSVHGHLVVSTSPLLGTMPP